MKKRWYIHDSVSGLSMPYGTEAEAMANAEDRVYKSGGECLVLELSCVCMPGEVVWEGANE